MEPYFKTENMAVGYDGHILIHDINIRLEKGKILTLIGPNGAGKSTILKSITRQLETISGRVYVGGQSLQQWRPKELAKQVAVVLTDRIRPELTTCAEVVAMGRYPYTDLFGRLTAQDKAAVREALAHVHTLDLAGRDFATLSDGQRQRILLARALCQEPEVIVLDEPTSFLDIRHKLELLGILKDMVRKRRLAVIMSLHELDLAQKISDYVVCVHNGTIERCGSPEEIFTSDYIMELYGTTRGSYNADFGCMELEPVRGEPKVFVIGGGGSGIATYRRLQRSGTPFAVGVLQENDLDYPVARALAVRVICERSFEPISEEAFQQAMDCMTSCRQVICCLTSFGTVNEKNRLLMQKAKEMGILTI